MYGTGWSSCKSVRCAERCEIAFPGAGTSVSPLCGLRFGLSGPFVIACLDGRDGLPFTDHRELTAEDMHKVYSHPSEAMVHLVKSELENHGIETVVRGEHAAAVM